VKKPRISIISAVAKGTRAIGKNNGLLFDLPEDLAHFKKVTLGHPVIMGLNTYKSLPFLLPGRLNIILTPDDLEVAGATVVHGLPEAYEKAAEVDEEEIFVIGGGYVYSQAIKDADRLYITEVDGDSTGADVFFPDYAEFSKVISSETSEAGGLPVKYLVLERES
jgi:dihydrofolate reductase